jgi:two-component system LytT family response regulator
MLAKYPQVEVVGEAADVKTAHRLYLRDRPNLLFLDIKLPRCGSLMLMPLLKDEPAVIFVTADSEFAAHAFEVHAGDCLLKPIDAYRLGDAIMRVNIPENELGIPSHSGYVSFKGNEGIRRVRVDSISHIEAVENYTRLHLTKGSPTLVRRSMVDWKKRLPEADFLRIARSLLIRIDAVRQLEARSRDISFLTLTGFSTPIKIGRHAALLLRRALEELKGSILEEPTELTGSAP